MKKAAGVLLLLTGFLAAMPGYAQERLTVKWNDPSRPGLLRVNWHNGSIIVKTHAGNDITIKANQVEPRPDPPQAGGLHRIDSGSRGISAESDSSNTITVGSRSGSGNGDLEIEVPVKTNLKLDSHNGAMISVDGVEGDMEISNHNGAITVTNAAGSVVADSHNARIVVSLHDIAAGKPMSFTSWNGEVDVTLPATTKANLKLRTDNGGVFTDFDVVKTGSPSNDRTTTGTINGGGPDFDLRTHNGNIYLRKGK